MLNLSENIAKSFRGATFFDSHCIDAAKITIVRLRVAELSVRVVCVWCTVAGSCYEQSQTFC